MIDYHHHTAFSVDSTAQMPDICEAAAQKGVTELAFTEHMDFIPEERNTGYLDYDAYMADIATCRERFAGRIDVLAAVEVDYCPDMEDEIAAWLDGKEFDFVVGSVHYIRDAGHNISEPRAADYFAERTVDEAYTEYFDLVLQCAEFGVAGTGRWDSLGHLDLVKRYGVVAYGVVACGDFGSCLSATAGGDSAAADASTCPAAVADRDGIERLVDRILRTVIDGGMALEVNTSGLRQGPAEAYPGRDVIERYKDLGGTRVTIGSDSHDAAHTGEGIAEGLRLLLSLGFDHVETFRKRVATSVPISELFGE